MKKLALLLLIVGILVAGGAVAAVGYYQLLQDDDGDEKAVKPVADIKYDPRDPQAGAEVTFTANNSNDPDGSNDKLNYLWDMGDGSTYDTAWTTHVFDAEGDYTVTLTVTDEQGLSATVEELVTVTSTSEVIHEDSQSGSVGGFDPQEDEQTFPVAESANKVELWWNMSDTSISTTAQVTVTIYDANDTEVYNQTQAEGNYYKSFEGQSLENKGQWRWVIRQESGSMDYDWKVKVWG